MDNTSDPIRLPAAPPDSATDGSQPRDPSVSLPISTLYYILVAIIFFAAGFIVAWVAFSTTQLPSLAADIQSAAADGARSAVRSELQTLQSQIASLAQGGAVAAAPTPAPIVPVNIDAGTSPTWGPENAAVTIVEFSDFECPFCGRYTAQTYPLLREKYGDRVRYVFKHYPIAGLHPDAERAGMAAECAHEQGRFWEYHDALFANQSDLSQAALLGYARQVEMPDMDQFTACLTTQKYAATVEADLQLGVRLGVTGTPTFFINGLPLVGAQPYSTFEAAIQQALQTSGAGG